MKLLDIYARKQNQLREIERELERTIRSDHVMLTEASLHLLKAGGKRIRPVFVLLAGDFGTPNADYLNHVAVSLELIHMASLVHDDVIDDADTRRGKPTVKSKWDNRVAMYTGDYMFAKALTVITRVPDPEIHRVLSHSMVQMATGEMEQIRYYYNTKQTIRDYLLRIRRKTALLLAVSCQLGAMAVGAPGRISQALYSFGYNAGMAFQIRDDVLDLCGDERQLGKPPGSDIRQGNITLPVIYSLRNPDLRDSLLADIAMIRAAGGNMDIGPFLDTVRAGGGIERAEHLANRYIQKAIAALKPLPDIEAKRNLEEIAVFIGSRNY